MAGIQEHLDPLEIRIPVPHPTSSSSKEPGPTSGSQKQRTTVPGRQGEEALRMSSVLSVYCQGHFSLVPRLPENAATASPSTSPLACSIAQDPLSLQAPKQRLDLL